MHAIPPPDIQQQLVPILACLPTAFLSPHPPPALFPLLTPILRQRLHFSASTGSDKPVRPNPEDPSTTWLRLLTWSQSRAKRLVEIASNMQIEPHPVSGEIELFGDDVNGDGGTIRYRRVDSETLQARCDVKEHGLGFIWTWCVNDIGIIGMEDSTPENKDGWRVSEVFPLDTGERDKIQWCSSISEAEDAFGKLAPQQNGAPLERKTSYHSEGGESDDSYWASYDRTPGRTPQKGTPRGPSRNNTREFALPTRADLQMTPARADAVSRNAPSSAKEEQDYYDRYFAEVQPAMDSHDPDEEAATSQFESSLRQQHAPQPPTAQPPSASSHSADSFLGTDTPSGANATEYATFLDSISAADPSQLAHLPVTEPPIASPPRSQLQSPRHDSTADLSDVAASAAALAGVDAPAADTPTAERGGLTMADAGPPLSKDDSTTSSELERTETVPAESSVKTHISTEMKSLYRLARGVGMSRREFERVIRTELDVLDMLEL